MEDGEQEWRIGSRERRKGARTEDREKDGGQRARMENRKQGERKRS